MILGVEASNIRCGGGVTHIVELFRVASPLSYGFSQVIIWSGQATLRKIEDRPWLIKSHQPLLDKRLPFRIFWQCFKLSKLVRMAGCDVLFVPGGSYASDFRPMVTMSQNLLPFEWRELKRFGWSWMTFKLLLLRIMQMRTFQRADGLIFLTQYAKKVVMGFIKKSNDRTVIIPHGVDERFFFSPREQIDIRKCSTERPFKIIYVSKIDMYKHQWHVAKAIAQLRQAGLPVVLDLLGPAYPPALTRLRRVMKKIDPTAQFIRYLGEVPHKDLHERYVQADLCLFASSCENMPNILLEGMASGLPIACSKRGPMSEILDDAGVYFDPENPMDIARSLRQLISSAELRAKKATDSFNLAKKYTWERCARETFKFLAMVAEGTKNHVQ